MCKQPELPPDHSIAEEVLAFSPAFHQKKLTLQPGASTAKHFHDNTHETYIVTGGLGQITVNSETMSVKPGDMIDVPPLAVHQIHNDGMWPLVVVSTKDKPLEHYDFIIAI
jgi:mannose-6-phosphate isomerase-like protein (cupin superfamily)